MSAIKKSWCSRGKINKRNSPKEKLNFSNNKIFKISNIQIHWNWSNCRIWFALKQWIKNGKLRRSCFYFITFVLIYIQKCHLENYVITLKLLLLKRWEKSLWTYGLGTIIRRILESSKDAEKKNIGRDESKLSLKFAIRLWLM